MTASNSELGLRAIERRRNEVDTDVLSAESFENNGSEDERVATIRGRAVDAWWIAYFRGSTLGIVT